jgi:hypothetical protein
MINRSQRLVLSARDAGSAGHIAALAANAALHGMDSLIVAEGAAHFYFETRRVPHVTADAWLTAISAPEKSKDAIALAGEKLSQLGACAVVCGRSSLQGEGIDRTVISAARLLDIPSFVVQDFWGDVWAEDCRPDHYLVIDEMAAQLTRQSTCADVHVIGSPKHAQYMHIDFQDLRQKGRAALGLGSETPTIGYFGQDLLGVPGYRQVLLDIGETIRRMHSVVLFYKPHPRETQASHSQSLKLLHESGVHPVVAENLTVEAAIATADVVLSCFSTVALDAAFMMCVNRATNVSIVCSDYPEDVSNFWRPATGLAEFPLVTEGIALPASDRSSLENALRIGLTPAERTRQATACRSMLSNPGESIERAYELITRITKCTTLNVRAKL